MLTHRHKYVRQNQKVAQQRHIKMKLKTVPFDHRAVQILEVQQWKEKVVRVRHVAKMVANHQEVVQVIYLLNFHNELFLLLNVCIVYINIGSGSRRSGSAASNRSGSARSKSGGSARSKSGSAKSRSGSARSRSGSARSRSGSAKSRSRSGKINFIS